MCVDANAGARFAAKQRAIEKEAKFNQRALQFYNKETRQDKITKQER